MKLLLVAVISFALLTLQSCSESDICSCVRSQAESMKESREKDYKGPKTVDPDCIVLMREMERESRKERAKSQKEAEECEAFADFEKERELFYKHIRAQYN